VPPVSHCFVLARGFGLAACLLGGMRSARVSMLFTDVARFGLCVDGLVRLLVDYLSTLFFPNYKMF